MCISICAVVLVVELDICVDFGKYCTLNCPLLLRTYAAIYVVLPVCKVLEI
jgi:hypothetical protein